MDNERTIFQIAICGSAEAKDPEIVEKAKLIGNEIANAGHILISGATTGYPFHAAQAAQAAGALSIGISPAANRDEHIHKYQKPTKEFDVLLMTGLGFTGRNVVLVRSADAIIFIGGRIGTVQEFCIGHAENKVLGVLKGSSPNADLLPQIAEQSGRAGGIVIYEADPKTLIDKVLSALDNR